VYLKTLLDDVIPFWSKNSPDWENGGYFTCLDTQGKVFDQDKFVWLQGRQVWMFSKLYNFMKQNGKEWHVLEDEAGQKTLENYLKIAKLGAEFLRDHGRDPATGYFYFALDKKGKPLVTPFSIFSDCFAAMGFAQYYKATGETWAKDLALRTFENIEKRKSNPRGQWSKGVGNNRPLQALNVPMIDLNLCLEMKDAIPSLDIHQRLEKDLEILWNVFLDKEKGYFHENVGPTKEDNECFEGRVVNPGHSLEALWFVLDVARYLNKPEQYYDKATECMLKILEFGWDKQYGGIFYFLDSEGKPTEQLEWDQKLWWVHQETLIALSLGFELTGKKELWNWYEKVHEYSWKHFHDPKHGEWFGYLNRRGEVSLHLKGGKWKGCFHTPRCMLLCATIFRRLKNKYSSEGKTQ
jgi:N-acylglucosamine 2-epimerase